MDDFVYRSLHGKGSSMIHQCKQHECRGSPSEESCDRDLLLVPRGIKEVKKKLEEASDSIKFYGRESET